MESTEELLARLERLCQEWQEFLGLRDWRIKVEISSDRELVKDSWATIDIVRDKRHARIKVADPRYGLPDDFWWEDEHDPEQSLLHELLHIYTRALGSFKNGSPQQIAEEQAVNAISQALLRLKRPSGLSQQMINWPVRVSGDGKRVR